MHRAYAYADFQPTVYTAFRSVPYVEYVNFVVGAERCSFPSTQVVTAKATVLFRSITTRKARLIIDLTEYLLFIVYLISLIVITILFPTSRNKYVLVKSSHQSVYH